MKEESDIKKLTEDEMKDLSDLHLQYSEVQNVLGQLTVRDIMIRQEKEILETSKEEAESRYVTIQQREVDLTDRLITKYGKGRFNIEQGTFEPNIENTPEL